MLQRTDQKPTLSSIRRSDASLVFLVLLVFGLVAAVLNLHSPEDALLTPEQISQMPLWGP
jgi:hypothetical protein